ncbi:MAG: PIN domain-containing protein [Terriglobales bacterium]
MSRVYWDSMLFIYWLEDHPQYAKQVDAIHSRMKQRQDRLITGAFTFGEVLAGTYRKGRAELADQFRALLRSVVAEIVPFTVETAEHYARIRGALGTTPADAIHLASAAQAGTDLFLTNDKNLVGKIVPGIQFIAMLDTQIL